METLGYLIYCTHLYTFFSNIFRKKRFACLKLLKNVQSEPKLNSFLKIKQKKDIVGAVGQSHRKPQIHLIVVLYMLNAIFTISFIL